MPHQRFAGVTGAGAIMSTHEAMKAKTQGMPRKTVSVNGRPYLTRFYGGIDANGCDVWYHNFLASDGDRHLHNHPFTATSNIICGGYLEEIETPDGIVDRLRVQRSEAATIGPSTWHRIKAVMPETWTIMQIERGRRVPFWFFIEQDGSYTAVKSSPPDWWKSADKKG